MKCIPMTLSGLPVAAASSVIGMEEVLEARMVAGAVISSRRAKTLVLSENPGFDGGVFDYRFHN